MSAPQPKGMSKAFEYYKPDHGVTAMAVTQHERDLTFLRTLFRDANWTLHETGTCVDALSALKRCGFDLVITERDLRDGDWRVMLHAIRDLPAPPPLIVTSRIADEYLWAEVLNEGGFDILTQPFDREEALRVISAATRRSENDKSIRTRQARLLSAGA